MFIIVLSLVACLTQWTTLIHASKFAYPIVRYDPTVEHSSLLLRRSQMPVPTNRSSKHVQGMRGVIHDQRQHYRDAFSNAVHSKGESIREILFRTLSKSEFEQVRNLPRRIQPYWDILSSLPKSHSLEMDKFGNVKNISMHLSPITLDLPPRLTLFNPTGKVNRIAFSLGAKTTFLVESDVEMFSRNTTIRIYQKIGDWYAEAELFDISLGSIVRHLPYSHRLNSLLKHPWLEPFSSIGFANSSVLIPIREQAYFLKVTGAPTLPVFNRVVPKMEMLLGWVNALPILAAIFHIDINQLPDALRQIPGLKERNWTTADWFLSRLPIASITYVISLSNINFSEYGDVGPDYFWATKSYFKKALPAWYSNPLSVGRTLAMAIRAPPNCEPGALWCVYLNYLLGENTFLFSAALDSLQFLEFRADLKSVNFGLFKLAPAAVLIALNPEWPHLAIFGQFNKTVSDGTVLTFQVEIGVAASSLSALDTFLRTNRCGTSVRMLGLWKTPFGIPWLTIGDMHIHKIGAYSLPWTLASDVFRSGFGGRFYIGRNCFNDTEFLPKSGCIAGSGDVIVDKKNFLAEGFSVKFNRLTLGDLVRNLFASNSLVSNFYFNNIDSVWQNTGFPEGLSLSFSWIPMQNPFRQIPQGLVLNASRINFGNYSARALGRIAVWSPAILFLDIELPAFKVGKIISVQRTANDQESGPMLFANITAEGAVAQGSVYVNVLDWFESYSELSLVNRRLTLEFAQGIPHWLQINSKVWSDWGRHIPSNFFWHLGLKVEWVTWFRESVSQVFESFGQRIDRKLYSLNASRQLLDYINASAIHSGSAKHWWQRYHNCSDGVLDRCVASLCREAEANSSSTDSMSGSFSQSSIGLNDSCVSLPSAFGHGSQSVLKSLCTEKDRRAIWKSCRSYCHLSKVSKRLAYKKLDWALRLNEKVRNRLAVYRERSWIERKIFFDISNAYIDGGIDDYMKSGYFEISIQGHIFNATAGKLVPWATKIRADHHRLLSAIADTVVHGARRVSQSVKSVLKPSKQPISVTPLIASLDDYEVNSDTVQTSNPVKTIVRDALATLVKGMSGYKIDPLAPENFELSHIARTADWSIAIHRQFRDNL